MARKPGKSTSAEGKAVQRSLQGINLGVTDCRLTPFPKSGKVARIRLLAKTAEAKQELESGMMEKHLLKTCTGLLGIEKKADDTLDLRFMPKGTPGRPPKTEQPAKAAKKRTAKKMSGRKKRTTRKVSHVKVTKNADSRKRLPEMRAPRNTSKKPHVRSVLTYLNKMYNDKQRAEIIEVLAKFATNTASCKKYEQLVAKLKGKIILDPKVIKKMSEALFEAIEHRSIRP